MRRTAIPLALALAALMPAAVADAATPFTVGQGVNPRIAVSPNGTGHVVWGIPSRNGASAAIGYCRIPAGASACDRSFTLGYPGGAGLQSTGNVTVQAESDTRIRIVGSCFNCAGSGLTESIHRFTTNNGGDTAPLAEPALGATPTTAGMGPDGVSVTSGLENPFVTPAEGDGVIARPAAAGKVDVTSGFLFVYTPSLVQVPGQNKLVHVVNDLKVVKTAVFAGPDLKAATIMNAANWTGDLLLPGAETENGETKLTAGPSGIWLTYQNRVPLDDHLGIRRFDPATNTFGAPRYLESAGVVDAGVGYPSSGQDAAGRVHAAWSSGYDTGRLRYVRSDPTGATFTEAANIAQGETFLDPEVGAGADGNGYAVWHGNGDTPIRVVRLEPYPEPGPSPPPTAEGVTPTGPPPAPTTTGSTRRTVRASVPGATIEFDVPRGCVQPGRTFRVTLKWKRKKRKGNLFVKVRRADFYIGKRRVKIDRKAPFVQTLRVTASTRRGSTITVRARAFIKVRRGKAPKKSIRATIKVCP